MGPNLRWRSASSVRAGHHNVSVAKINLCAVDQPASVAVTIVLAEAEYSREPGHSFGHILINDVGKQNISGDGTIL